MPPGTPIPNGRGEPEEPEEDPEPGPHRSAWQRVDDMVPGALHEWADDEDLAPGLVPVGWMLVVMARGYTAEGSDIEQMMVLRSGSPTQLLGIAEYGRMVQFKDLNDSL
jgi:hypothetical protein